MQIESTLNFDLLASVEQVKLALDKAAGILQIQTQDEWYDTTRTQLRHCCKEMKEVLDSFHTVQSALCTAYPFYDWYYWRYKKVSGKNRKNTKRVSESEDKS